MFCCGGKYKRREARELQHRAAMDVEQSGRNQIPCFRMPPVKTWDQDSTSAQVIVLEIKFIPLL